MPQAPSCRCCLCCTQSWGGAINDNSKLRGLADLQSCSRNKANDATCTPEVTYAKALDLWDTGARGPFGVEARRPQEDSGCWLMDPVSQEAFVCLRLHFGTIWVYRGEHLSLTHNVKYTFSSLFKQAESTQIPSRRKRNLFCALRPTRVEKISSGRLASQVAPFWCNVGNTSNSSHWHCKHRMCIHMQALLRARRVWGQQVPPCWQPIPSHCAMRAATSIHHPHTRGLDCMMSAL